MTPELEGQIRQELEAARQSGFDEGYARAKCEFLLKASDELNASFNAHWRRSKETLEQWAREIGRPLHQGVPDLPDITPPNFNRV